MAESLAVAEWRALGGSVRLVVTDADRLGPARAAVETVLAEIDAACSRFRPDSEVSRLLALGSSEPVEVSHLLAKALDLALRAARITDGAVDPTVGTAMRAVGYDRDFSQMPAQAGEISLRLQRVPGWQVIELDRPRRRVRIPRGIEIDLGATGKGLAADMGAEAALGALGTGGVLVSLGGDIALAGDPPAGGWRIQVEEDSGAPLDRSHETISLSAGAVATSSTTVRRWQRGSVTLHHIVDPRTGLPADGPWRTATVVAGTCVDANTASTAAIVRGEAALADLQRWGLAARLVDREGQVVKVGGWPG